VQPTITTAAPSAEAPGASSAPGAGLYILTVRAGQGGVTAGSTTGFYDAGSFIEVTEITYLGNHFIGWMVNGVTLTNYDVETIKFVMPEHDVEVTAQFEGDVTEETEADVNPKAGVIIGFTSVMLSGSIMYIVKRRFVVKCSFNNNRQNH